jgi:DUF1680 family protein
MVERADLFGGVVAIRAEAAAARAGNGGGKAASAGAPGELYTHQGPQDFHTAKQLLFIPYYTWANRTPGEMAVWIRE